MMLKINWPDNDKTTVCSVCWEMLDKEPIKIVVDTGAIMLAHDGCMMDVAFAFRDLHPRRKAELPYIKSRLGLGYNPFLWQNSTRYSMSIRVYLDHKVIKTPLIQQSLDDVIDYINHYLFASCWIKGPNLINLRLQADEMKTFEDVEATLKAAAEEGIDIL